MYNTMHIDLWKFLKKKSGWIYSLDIHLDIYHMVNIYPTWSTMYHAYHFNYLIYLLNISNLPLFYFIWFVYRWGIHIPKGK